MAITAPPDFSHSIGYAPIGGTVYFTWEKGTGDIEWYVIMMRNQMDTSKEQKYYFLPSETSAAITIPGSGSNVPDIGDVLDFNLAAGRGDKNNPSEYSECNTTCVVYIREDTSGTPTPPMAAASGKLEQFQNSAGEQVYPRTVIEGIFRQSDSRTLTEILAELLDAPGGPELELPLGIADGGTGADNAQLALANLIDGGNPLGSNTFTYSGIYVPFLYNGECYKLSFSTLQRWTTNRTSSANQTDTNYSTFMARGIAAGTSDYAAGSTAMTSGTIYLVYE